MGLDIYVGSLTRYYRRDWETIVQKFGRERGIPVEIVRPDETAEETLSVEATQQAISEWRTSLTAALADHLAEPLNWAESPTAPYFTDKLTWDCYSDLLLWAAYLENPGLSRPHDTIADFGSDPAYLSCSRDSYSGRFLTLLRCEWWLPGEFGFIFPYTPPAGEECWIGSSAKLLADLRALNLETWNLKEPSGQGDWPDMPLRGPLVDCGNEWSEVKEPLDRSMEAGAKFGLGMMLWLARMSVDHSLPMKLDY